MADDDFTAPVTLPGRDDRQDWAILDAATGEYLGEIVLNEHDADNEALGFRAALSGQANLGRGIGTEASRPSLRGSA